MALTPAPAAPTQTPAPGTTAPAAETTAPEPKKPAPPKQKKGENINDFQERLERFARLSIEPRPQSPSPAMEAYLTPPPFATIPRHELSTMRRGEMINGNPRYIPETEYLRRRYEGENPVGEDYDPHPPKPAAKNRKRKKGEGNSFFGRRTFTENQNMRGV
jgi:hypothetical protein